MVIITIASMTLILSTLIFIRSVSPPKIKLSFDAETKIKAEETKAGEISTIQFTLDAVFSNVGGTTGAIMNIYPKIIKPEMKLDPVDKQTDQQYWYQMDNGPSRKPVEGKVLEGSSMYPAFIKIRLYQRQKDEEEEKQWREQEFTMQLNYKIPDKKEGNLQNFSKSHTVTLEIEKVKTLS